VLVGQLDELSVHFSVHNYIFCFIEYLHHIRSAKRKGDELRRKLHEYSPLQSASDVKDTEVEMNRACGSVIGGGEATDTQK
jgi:hypothetical protein